MSWHAEVNYTLAPPGVLPDSPNPFVTDGNFGPEWTGLAFTATTDCFYGLTRYRLFLQTFSLRWCDPETVLADFLRYETAQGRKAILFLPEELNGDAFVARAMAGTPPPHIVRSSDPQVLVHSTSLAAGRAILQDGAIKSSTRLSAEGWASQWHRMRSSDLGEPKDYADLVQFGLPDSAGCEMVVAAHQSGAYVSEDQVYQPGIRFYVDAHQIIQSGLETRFGGGIVVRGQLPLEPYILAAVSFLDLAPAVQAVARTPKGFTAAANDLFAAWRREQPQSEKRYGRACS